MLMSMSIGYSKISKIKKIIMNKIMMIYLYDYKDYQKGSNKDD